jgi:hypothetical protein
LLAQHIDDRFQSAREAGDALSAFCSIADARNELRERVALAARTRKRAVVQGPRRRR